MPSIQNKHVVYWQYLYGSNISSFFFPVKDSWDRPAKATPLRETLPFGDHLAIPHLDGRQDTARSSVGNLSARRTIWYAARRSTCLIEDSSSGYIEYTQPLDEGFYAILGSENGANSMRLLIDHREIRSGSGSHHFFLIVVLSFVANALLFAVDVAFFSLALHPACQETKQRDWRIIVGVNKSGTAWVLRASPYAFLQLFQR
jgi:hypothetical protein